MVPSVRPGELVELARVGRIRAVTSLYILDEFQRVLTPPRFGISARSAEDLALEMATFMDVVSVGPSRGAWVSEPADDPIVETALEGHAGIIVTGDRRLREVGGTGGEYSHGGEDAGADCRPLDPPYRRVRGFDGRNRRHAGQGG